MADVMELRDRIAEVLADDGWEGHSEPLTRADLESIADALLPLVRAERGQAISEVADEFEKPRTLYYGDGPDLKSGVYVMVNQRTLESVPIRDWLRARAEQEAGDTDGTP